MAPRLAALAAIVLLAGCGGDPGAAPRGAAASARHVVLHFPATDGRRLRGRLTPATRPHAPAVVLVHGLYGEPAQWDGFVGELHRAGFTTLAYASRSDHQPDEGVLVRDLVGAVRALRARPEADPDRIALAGSSVGGSAVAYALGTRPGLPVRGGVAFSALEGPREVALRRAPCLPPPRPAADHRPSRGGQRPRAARRRARGGHDDPRHRGEPGTAPRSWPIRAPASRRSPGSSASRRDVARFNGLMDFDLSPDHELIRRTVREFAEGEIAPVAEELDREKRFPYEIVAQLGELGLMGIPFPEEVGGAGGDTLAYAIAVEELARVDSSVAITMCAHTSLGTQPIYLFGTRGAEGGVAAGADARAGGWARSG